MAAVIMASGAAGCHAGRMSGDADTEAITQVQRLDRTLGAAAREAGILPVALGALDANAVVLYPRAPVVMGRTRAREAFAAAAPLPVTRAGTWTPIGAAMSDDSTMATTWGRVDWRVDSSGTDVARAASYLAAWVRISPSLWRIAAIDWTGVPAEMDPTNITRSAPVERSTLDAAAGAMWDADVAFAKLAGDSGAPVAFRVFAAADAFTFAGPGVYHHGPSAIETALARGPAANATWEWTPVFARASADGSLGFTIGESTIVLRSTDGTPPPVYLGKYLTVWRRQKDGSYRYLTDAGSER